MHIYLGGVLASLVTAIWLVVIAFREDVRWGLACLFVPFAVLAFVFTHWGRAARPFACMLIAAGITIVGSVYAESRGKGLDVEGTWREKKGTMIVRIEKGGRILSESSGTEGQWKRLSRDAFSVESFDSFSGGTYDPEADTMTLSETGMGSRGRWVQKTQFVRVTDGDGDAG